MAGSIDNFSLLRLILASAVVISHGFSIPTGDNTLEPLFQLTRLRLGEHAVNCFFAISGFLVTMSFVNRGPRDYVIARVLRIAPAFVVASLVTVFGIGLAFTQISTEAYLTDPNLYKYLWQVLTGFKSAGQMPGVFMDNPHPWPLGTIWTLRYEIALYAAVLLFGIAGAFRSAHIIGGIAAFLLLGSFLCEIFLPQMSRYVDVMLRLVTLFMLGSLFFLVRETLFISWGLAAFLVGLAWFSFGTPLYLSCLYVAEAYGILVLAFGAALPFVTLTDRADLSYGMYLYGYPIQQGLVALYPNASPFALLMPALVVSGAFAWASWTFVEKPALRLKQLWCAKG